jgi:hypothetical protein
MGSGANDHWAQAFSAQEKKIFLGAERDTRTFGGTTFYERGNLFICFLSALGIRDGSLGLLLRLEGCLIHPLHRPELGRVSGPL